MEVTKLAEIDTLYKIDELQLKEARGAIKTDSVIISAYKQNESAYSANEAVLKKEVADLQSNVKRLKFQKALAFISMAILSTLCVVEYIK